MSDDIDRFDEEMPQDEVPAVPAIIAGPRAFPVEQWDMIPNDLREEASERASWIIFRGISLDDALIVALDGMRTDIEGLSPEPSWKTVRSLARLWPRLPRGANGCYRKDLLEMASALERGAQDAALGGGSGEGEVRDLFASRLPEAVHDLAAAEFYRRSDEIRVQLQMANSVESLD